MFCLYNLIFDHVNLLLFKNIFKFKPIEEMRQTLIDILTTKSQEKVNLGKFSFTWIVTLLKSTDVVFLLSYLAFLKWGLLHVLPQTYFWNWVALVRAGGTAT